MMLSHGILQYCQGDRVVGTALWSEPDDVDIDSNTIKYTADAHLYGTDYDCVVRFGRDGKVRQEIKV